MAVTTPICQFGWPAPEFNLPGVDGQRHTLHSARGPNGLLVMFICNHCPYVQAIIDRIVRDTRDLATLGIGSIAIMSNDTEQYPEDAWENMVHIAEQLDFPFPYVLDETQNVARAYGAVCTPDFFGFDTSLTLQYRGRLDASGRMQGTPDTRRELFEAMQAVAAGRGGPHIQTPSIGCSIKWRELLS